MVSDYKINFRMSPYAIQLNKNSEFKQSAWLDRSSFSNTENSLFPFSISMLSWAYNEEENIVDFLIKSQKFMGDLEVDFEHILIDDGSRDKTFELATSYRSKYPQLKIIRNSKNLGVGWNVKKAVEAAQKDIVFWQTVDWSYDIEYLKDYLWLLRYYDIIQGVRIKDREASPYNIQKHIPILKNIEIARRSDNLNKAIISVVNYIVIKSLFRVPLHDFQNVTVYPRKLIQSIEIESESAFTNPELIIKSYWRGASIAQVPFSFIARKKGEAKGTQLKPLMTAVSQIFYLWLKWYLLDGVKKERAGRINLFYEPVNAPDCP